MQGMVRYLPPRRPPPPGWLVALVQLAALAAFLALAIGGPWAWLAFTAWVRHHVGG